MDGLSISSLEENRGFLKVNQKTALFLDQGGTWESFILGQQTRDRTGAYCVTGIADGELDRSLIL